MGENEYVHQSEVLDVEHMDSWSPEPMHTGSKPPFEIRCLSKRVCDERRQVWNIVAEGEYIPASILNFKDMLLPEPLLAELKIN